MKAAVRGASISPCAPAVAALIEPRLLRRQRYGLGFPPLGVDVAQSHCGLPFAAPWRCAPWPPPPPPPPCSSTHRLRRASSSAAAFSLDGIECPFPA